MHAVRRATAGLAGVLVALAAAVIIFGGETSGLGAIPAAENSCPVETSPTVSSPEIPTDVCIPDGFTAVPMDFFDDYSWRLFVAEIWPAADGRRGIGNARKRLGDDGPRVFETYRSLWEIFHRDGSAPSSAFDSYEASDHSPCGVTAGFSQLVLGSSTGIPDLRQAGNGSFEGPLAAQNGKYVRYLTLFNRVAFDHLVRNRLYLRSSLPSVPKPRPVMPVVDFPDGSIAIKTAWVDVAGLPAALQRRIYQRRATVRDPDGSGCSTQTVGLVGLHIAQKTPSRPQWIWSSFEQEDNVPPARPNAPGVFTFNDGSGAAMPTSNPLSLARLARQPVRPFNVERLETVPIHPLTVLMNFRYQELLKGTVWQYYRLVVTQWPRLEGNQAVPVPASQDGSVPNTFPGLGAFSAFTNVTLETFDQSRVQLGCMSCHNEARMQADFMWTVVNHAYPAQISLSSSDLGTRKD